jgi:(1->4)-alpha-D-glucan 1-alpha-D-glucosylmutase
MLTRRAALAALDGWLDQAEGVRSGRIEAATAEHAAALTALIQRWWDGHVKLYTLSAALRLRRAAPAVFLVGDYVPLEAHPADDHLVAFARRLGEEVVVAMVPRFLATMLRGEPRLPLGVDGWPTGRVALPPDLGGRRFVNVLTGEVVRPLSHGGSSWLLASDVFTTWPLGLLASR